MPRACFEPKYPVIAFLFAVQTLVAPPATSQEQPPGLEFPLQGLDDMAAYRDYQTRFYRDVSGNTVQIVLNQAIGRVVNLWADAANESMSFSLRDSSNKMPRFACGSPGARDTTDGALRIVEYTLTVHSPVVMVGHVLLGSMRKERDFQYARQEFLPLDSLPPVEPGLLRLVANIGRLPAEEKRAQLSLLLATNEDEVLSRLQPHLALLSEDGHGDFTVRQRKFDGANYLLLQISGDTTRSHAALTNGVLTVRSHSGSTLNLTVRIGTDSQTLTPLKRTEIFTPEFELFYNRMQAAASRTRGQGRSRFELLDRQVKSVELLSSKEKLMAGLPNYATYFGRDMMMSAMMLEPVLKPSMQEHVISAVLRSFVLPYPVGLFVNGLGTLVANDAYASPQVWDRFEKDQYHSPRVVWGREVNLMLLGAMKMLQGFRDTDNTENLVISAPVIRELKEVLKTVLTAVDTSGMKQNELWTYKIAGGTLSPARYEFSCDIQLWNLTDLAVQFEYDRLKSGGQKKR